jgi:DNA-binding response OmpR family regulator
MNHILTIVDEPDLIALLIREGFEVKIAKTGSEILAQLCRNRPDLILLSAMVPDMDGFELCRRIRAMRKRPLAVLMLSEHATAADRIKGLECGADDYIDEPVDLTEMLARIHAGLRRINELTGRLQKLEVGDLVLDTSSRQVWRSGELVALTKREYDLLELLAKNAGRVLSKECIFDRVWGWDSQANWEVIKVYMNYLRAKLNKGGKADLIHAIRGVGYVLRPEIEDSLSLSSVH